MLRLNFTGSCFMTSVPSTVIDPEVGSTKRLIIFIVVVLPHPEGPTSTTVSPSPTSMDRSETAGGPELWKRFVTFFREIMVFVTRRSWCVGPCRSILGEHTYSDRR